MSNSGTSAGPHCGGWPLPKVCLICLNDLPHDHQGLYRKENRKWIGVDFDGTLALDVAGRTDPYTLGKPVPEMVKRVQDWLAEGFDIRLLTARMHPISYSCGGIQRDLGRMEAELRAWCAKHVGVELACTCQKDGLMEVLWDDRAVRVVNGEGNTYRRRREGECCCFSVHPDYCEVHAA